MADQPNDGETLAPPEFEDVERAAENILAHANRTAVITCETLDRFAGHQLFFKCENFQKTGSFKFRGALNAISHLSDDQRSRGVVTHSSGNHAQALAAAAALFGIKSHIVMPSNSAEVKKAAVAGYGGAITECEPTLEARESKAAVVATETGATMIPPFNHPYVIAGQGTCAMEFLQQVPNLDFVIAPVGGGGLISGTCITVKATSPRAVVIGAEPVGADDAFRSKKAGEFIAQSNPQTIADGLRTSLGSLTWPFINRQVKRVARAEETEIVETMKLFLERTKILIEPSAAVAVAVALNHMGEQGRPKNIGVIISGGNIDLDQLPWP